MSGPDSTPPPEQPTPIFSAPPAPTSEDSQLLKFPEDIRTRWGWKDILIFVVVTIGMTFAVGLAAVIISVATGHSVQALQNSAREKALFAVIATAIVSLAQLAFFYFFIGREDGQSFWWALGWRSLRSGDRRLRFGPAALHRRRLRLCGRDRLRIEIGR